MPPTPTLNLEKLRTGKQTGPLSEETQAEIAAVAEAEIKQEEEARLAAEAAGAQDQPPAGGAEPKVVDKTAEELEAEKKKEDEAAAKKAEEDKAEQERLEKEAKDADDAVIAAIMAKPDEELSDEEKTRKRGLIEKNPDLAFQEEIKTYAKEEGISVEEAKEALEAEKKIVDQHKGDPRKIARSYRSTQRAYSRLETKIKQEQEQAASVLKDNEVVWKGKKMTFDEAREQMIPHLREQMLGKSVKIGDKDVPIAEVDDDKVFELAKTAYQAKIKAHMAQVQEKNTEAAKKKRELIISKLPANALQFKSQFSELLDFVGDRTVLEEDFDPDYVLTSARGAFYTPEKVKEIEAASFKRGQENAQILGAKNNGASGAGHGTSTAAKEGSPDADLKLLTADDEKRALDMFQGATFDNAGWDKARKLKEYVGHLKDVGEWPPKKKP